MKKLSNQQTEKDLAKHLGRGVAGTQDAPEQYQKNPVTAGDPGKRPLKNGETYLDPSVYQTPAQLEMDKALAKSDRGLRAATTKAVNKKK